MATLSVVATPDPTNMPPRVKVDITDTGTPTITSVTVTRTDNSGTVSTVRTSDGSPLPLVTSGSNRVGTVYDYVAPFGVPVTYSTVEQPANQSSTVTSTSTKSWLIHPGVPDRSMSVDFRIGSFDSAEWPVNSGIFHPMGRPNAVWVSDGQRQAGGNSMMLAIETASDLVALKGLLSDAGVLFLNVPTSLGLGVDPAYIGVTTVRPRRRSDIGSDPYRDVELPYVIVDPPVGGTQAQYNWADVVAKYATWSALLAKNTTWAQVQAPTG